jgi:hypothetical protein
MTERTTSRGLGSTLPRFFGSLCCLLGFAAAALGSTTPAYAVSGDGGEAAPFSAICAGGADVIYPCGTDGEQCELTPQGGIPVGFCEDGVFDALVREVVSGPLEFGVFVDRTSFGTVTILPDSIIFCRTFATQKSCRQIFDDEGPAQDCPASCGSLIDTESSSCADEAAELAASIAPGLQAADLAFVASVDYQTLADPGSISLAICPSHRCACFDPGVAHPDAVIQAQVPYSDIHTPGCTRVGGTRYCSPLR